MNKQAKASTAIIITLLILILLAIAVVITLQVTGNLLTGKITSASGEIISKSYNVSNFEKINLLGRGDIFLTQGTEYSVEIKADKNIIENLDVEVQENTLKIGDTGFLLFNINPIKIYVTMPEVTSVRISGSGNIQNQNIINSQDLSLIIDGSGKINMNLNVERLNTNILGSGSATYLGTADKHIIRIDGSGSIKAFDLTNKITKINIMGSGSTQVSPQDNLDVKISGSGSVKYMGSPIIDQSISGSGSVKKIE